MGGGAGAVKQRGGSKWEMRPSELDALLGVLGLPPSRWTLARQAEREQLQVQAARRKRRKVALRAGHKGGTNKKRNAARAKRKRWLEVNQSDEGRVRLRLERWAGGRGRRFRPLREVQEGRARLLEHMPRGVWLEWRAIEELSGTPWRYLDSDLRWAVTQGLCEVRRVDRERPRWRLWGGARQWRRTAKPAIPYVPGPRQAVMYARQALAEVLNG